MKPAHAQCACGLGLLVYLGMSRAVVDPLESELHDGEVSRPHRRLARSLRHTRAHTSASDLVLVVPPLVSP